MKNFKTILICISFFLLFSSLLFAGKIRTVNVDKTTMGKVNLSLGRSTVLNFDSPPLKIISGNANYFNIEFTGHDVTIQPLGAVESNIFVYTENHRYGLILKSTNSKVYDDLVYVKWFVPRIPRKQILKDYPSVSKAKRLKISLLNIQKETSKNLYLLDLEVTNLSRSSLSLNSNSIWITRSNKVLPILEKVFAKEKLSIGESSRIRLVIRLDSKNGFTTHFKVGKNQLKFIVWRKYL